MKKQFCDGGCHTGRIFPLDTGQPLSLLETSLHLQPDITSNQWIKHANNAKMWLRDDALMFELDETTPSDRLRLEHRVKRSLAKLHDSPRF